ncbi:MAG: hypothetical protein IT443_11910 [Phycisphaeraceae bacterium]|nr:hypothetical protein [Phycisphaeraceae bacterium]
MPIRVTHTKIADVMDLAGAAGRATASWKQLQANQAAEEQAMRGRQIQAQMEEGQMRLALEGQRLRQQEEEAAAKRREEQVQTQALQQYRSQQLALGAGRLDLATQSAGTNQDLARQRLDLSTERLGLTAGNPQKSAAYMRVSGELELYQDEWKDLAKRLDNIAPVSNVTGQRVIRPESAQAVRDIQERMQRTAAAIDSYRAQARETLRGEGETPSSGGGGGSASVSVAGKIVSMPVAPNLRPQAPGQPIPEAVARQLATDFMQAATAAGVPSDPAILDAAFEQFAQSLGWR